MYRTFDLIQRHPKFPQKWRIYGRADDQIMLSTGEKVCSTLYQLTNGGMKVPSILTNYLLSS